VNIDCPIPGELEHRLRENQTISGDYDDVGSEAFEFRLRTRVPKIYGLGYLNSLLCRQLLHWGWRQRKTAPGRSVRLGYHPDYTMLGLEERLKAACRKLRSAGEENIHSGRLADLFLKLGLDALLL
jgi:hypothetical protein